MGKKKNQQRVQQSMGQMVSRAALAQLGPEIEKLTRSLVNQMGNQLAMQQASTLETLFARVVVLETIVMEKLGYTAEDLVNKVAALEDEKEGLVLSMSQVELNDVVRLDIRTKAKDQTEYQGSSRLKIYDTGSGNTLGKELEEAILGMTTGETKEVSFGKDKAMLAELKVDRVSRLKKNEETPSSTGAADASTSQG